MSLPCRSSLPWGFPSSLVAPGHVEDVVDDLEQDAELVGEPAVGNCLRFGHALEGQHDADAGGDQPPGLQRVQRAQPLGVRRRPPATSTYWPPTMPSTPVAAVSSRERGEHPGRLARLLAEEPDRLGEEAVAGEDRDVLAELDVRGRLAAAQLVVVHRRQVVVDQRVGVDQLDRRGGRQEALGLGAERARRGQARAPGGSACRRPAASSASPPRARRSRARRRTAARRGPSSTSAREVVRVASRRRRSRWRSGRVVGSRHPRVGLARRSCLGESSAASRASSAARSSLGLLAVQLAGDRLQPRRRSRASRLARQLTSPPLRSRAAAPRIAVDESGRVGAAVLLGDLDRLVDRDLGRHVARARSHRGRPASRCARAARSARAPSPARGAAIDRVELLAVRLDPLGELAGEGARLGEQLLERAAGDVALVAGEDGVAALVGAAHERLFSRFRRLGARDVLAAAGVDPDRSRPRR